MRMRAILLGIGCCLPVMANEVVDGMTDYLSKVLSQQTAQEYEPAPTLGASINRGAGVMGAETTRRQALADGMQKEVQYGLGIKPPGDIYTPPLELPPNSEATVDASLLLNNTNLSQNDSALAQRLIRNVSMPQPSLVTPTDPSNPQAMGKTTAKNAEAYTKESALSVAQHSWMNIYAMRQQSTTMPGSSAPISLMDLMEAEATGRYTDPNWYKSTALASPEAVARELLYMEAFRNWMIYQQYRQGERIEALLATLVTSQGEIGQMTRNLQNQMDNVPSVAPNLNAIKLQ